MSKDVPIAELNNDENTALQNRVPLHPQKLLLRSDLAVRRNQKSFITLERLVPLLPSRLKVHLKVHSGLPRNLSQQLAPTTVELTHYNYQQIEQPPLQPQQPTAPELAQPEPE